MKTLVILAFVLCLAGCGYARVETPNVSAEAWSLGKDHALDQAELSKTGDDIAFKLAGYSSQAKLDLIKALLGVD